MDKNWLIRTKSNHILGPISKEKVLELYHNGSIKPDDEVCSGNGYWFFIREDDLVSRYLLGNEPQGFNPISEAKDVLTGSAQSRMSEGTSDDITLVGGLNLSMLKEAPPAATGMPPAPEVASPVPAKPATSSNQKESTTADSKKKNDIIAKAQAHFPAPLEEPPVPAPKPPKAQSKAAPVAKPKVPKKPMRKQSWLKYVGVLGFLLLFCLIYFRKSIIQHLFRGEITATISFMNEAHAQEIVPEEKKKLLDSEVIIDKVIFRPEVGLSGFRVVSSFSIEELKCEDLNNAVYQLGILLHPPEVINENFLIKLRDCVLKLPDIHPLKKWMKWIGESRPESPVNQQKIKFLTEIINSQFNLITDSKVKNEIINILYEIPEETVPEQILRAYLYIMTGNITRSDNILRKIVTTSPRGNWAKTGLHGSIFHKMASDQIQQIFKKLNRHPADRKSFELLALYLQSFYNEESIVKVASEVDTSELESKLGLKFIESMAPPFVHYLRFSRMGENRRMKLLRQTEVHPFSEQVYWVWPFIEISPLISEAMIPELKKLEESDELWFIYLMENEKLADLYSRKAGKSFLPARRPFLKSQLQNDPSFMMSLFKLIQLGDINPELISQTIEQLIDE